MVTTGSSSATGAVSFATLLATAARGFVVFATAAAATHADFEDALDLATTAFGAAATGADCPAAI